MNCIEERICAIRATHIDQEIDSSLRNMQSQKVNAVQAVKIYLTIITGLFAYFGFLNTKIITATNPSPANSDFFAIFGVAIILVCFSCGWILLDYVTNTIFSSIVQFKHISYMRKLKSEKFNGRFSENCVFPIGAKKIPLKRSRHLPIIFCLINFILLSTIYYSLSIAFQADTSLTYTLLILGIFTIYFPNVCVKYYEETAIAQFIRPSKDESTVRQQLRKKVARAKAKPHYQLLRWLLTTALIVFFVSTAINLIALHYNNIPIPYKILNTQTIALLAIIIFRYLMVQYRVSRGTPKEAS